MSLVSYFKSNPLNTHVGELSYNGQLGQSGNSTVLSFIKGGKKFAVKFIKEFDKKKLARFVDEYFCAAQIDTHPNVARLYHLESINVEGDQYSIILMKEYDSTLDGLKTIVSSPDDEKSAKGWKLLNSLLEGLNHLHTNDVIHRDIKPQNIFYDAIKDCFVLGDLGIAHFSESYGKQATTKVGERLSNYLFSAPEQYDPKVPPAPNWDIYAIGQVMSWYLFDLTVRGDGREQYGGEDKELSILDRIIHKCVQNDPSKRFQTVEQIRLFEKSRRVPARDPFAKMYDFDEVIRSSLPKIRDIYESNNPREIDRFLTNLKDKCLPNEFWWINAEGGDNTLEPIQQLTNGRWLFQNTYEVKIGKLICYRTNSLWSNFCILLLEPDELFSLVDFDGSNVLHDDASEWETDYAVMFKGSYMRWQEFENGHYEHNGEVFKTPADEATPRYRYLRNYAYMIVPRGSGPDRIDVQQNEDLLQSVIQNQTLDVAAARKYLYEASNHASREIMNML